LVNVTVTSTSWLMALAFNGTGKTARPSEVVVAVTVVIVESGHKTFAVPVAPPTPIGLPFTL
jgi:hypothetical protein